MTPVMKTAATRFTQKKRFIPVRSKSRLAQRLKTCLPLIVLKRKNPLVDLTIPVKPGQISPFAYFSGVDWLHKGARMCYIFEYQHEKIYPDFRVYFNSGRRRIFLFPAKIF